MTRPGTRSDDSKRKGDSVQNTSDVQKLNDKVEQMAAKFAEDLRVFRKDLESRATASSTTSKADCDLTELSKRFSDFETSVLKSLKELKSSISQMNFITAKNDMAANQNMVLLHGVPESVNQNIYQEVTNTINTKIGVKIEKCDLDYCHRLGPSRASATRPRPIVVSVCHRWLRNDIFNSKKRLKGSGIFLTELLTFDNLKIFKECKKYFPDACYTMGGRVVVINGGVKVVVTSMEKLTTIVSKVFPNQENGHEIQQYVYQHKFEVCGITETWLSPSYDDTSFKLNGYQFIRKDRIGKKLPPQNCDVIPISQTVSDHWLVFANFDLALKRSPKRNIKFRDYNGIVSGELERDALSLNWDLIYHTSNINDKLNIFNSYVLFLIDRHAPFKYKTVQEKPYTPWITSNIKLLMKMRDSAYRKYLQHKSDAKLQQYRQLRNFTKHAIAREKIAYFHSLSVRPGNEFWKDAEKLNLTKENKYPDLWKRAVILPLPKVSNPKELKDLRPISILPAVSKILEKHIYNQILLFMESKNIVPATQSGFRKNFSTSTCLVNLVNDVRFNQDKKEITGLCLLDFAGAFDTLCHGVLLSKLHYFGFSDQALAFFRSYLTGRSQCAVMKHGPDKIKSNYLPVSSGVPQGSVLGPLLFSLYVADMEESIVNSKLQQFADDSQLILKSKQPSYLYKLFITRDHPHQTRFIDHKEGKAANNVLSEGKLRQFSDSRGKEPYASQTET
ncbi:hypothetical protein HUJ04_007219 [Dendroctonus ponderosae]|nr:hypothetical protein HUJ04_007219 [Dendroctonus ponderosae]